MNSIDSPNSAPVQQTFSRLSLASLSLSLAVSTSRTNNYQARAQLDLLGLKTAAGPEIATPGPRTYPQQV